MQVSRLSSRTYQIIYLILMLVGFAVRVHQLGSRSLWFDEAMEYWVATSEPSEILPAARSALQDPPLYSVMLNAWLRVGHSEFVVRFPSALMSVVGLLGTIVLARITLGHRAGVAAGILTALSVPDIRFAQEAGQYALMSCILTWYLVCLTYTTTRMSWRWALLCGVSGAAAIYSYYGASLTIGATTVTCALLSAAKRQWNTLLKVVAVALLIGLLIAPLITGWLPDQLFRGPTSGAFQVSLGTPRDEVARFITQTGAILLYHVVGHQPEGWPPLPHWSVWLWMAALALVGAVHSKFRIPTLWLIATLAVYYAVGRLGAYPYGGRHSLILSSLLWTCVAGGLVGLQSWEVNRHLANVLALSLLGWIVLIGRLAPPEPQEDLRSVTQFWLEEREPDEPTYVYYGAVPGFRYQINQFRTPKAVPPLWYRDCWRGETATHCAEDKVHYGEWIRGRPPEKMVEAIFRVSGGRPAGLWIVFSHIHQDEDETILAYLEGACQTITSRTGENSGAYFLQCDQAE